MILGPWLPLESAAHVTELRGLAVAPGHQGQGIGGRLIEAAIERARRDGARRLVLRVLSTNPAARRLYERHGFEVEGAHRKAFLLEGAYVDDQLMALDLTRESVVGIDVGGKRKGFHCCALVGREIVGGPTQLRSVEEAVRWVARFRPTTVAVDSPCEAAAADAKARADELEFNQAGICRIRFTPGREKLAGNPYYGWIEHGLELYEALAARLPGAEVIETFPTAAWTIWSGRREGRSRGAWSQDALDALDLEGLPGRRPNQDDRDAIAAALVARLYAEGRTTSFGKIIVPAGPLP